MQNTPVRTVFGEITEFLATNPTPKEIIDYQLPEIYQQRASELVEKNSADTLSSAEYDEMMDLLRVDNMLSLLKTKMRLKLGKTSE